MAKPTLIVDGRRTTVEADPETPLPHVLRNDLGLRAAEFGCGLGQCGACTPVPAVFANAIFDASGVRLRSVLLTPAKLRGALRFA